MSHLKPDTFLKRANEIEIWIDSVTEILVSTKDSKTPCSNICLTILEVFASPLSIREALEKLNSKGLFDWSELTGNINKLHKIGALIKPSEIQVVAEKQLWGFGAPPVHIGMLSDHDRTQKFIKAITEKVKKGDVVIDIGTGTGILAIAAARAGASKVYAIEASGIADIAQQIIDKTEVADKIVIIRDWSSKFNLPHPADVLVSEIIGNDPFAEEVLQVFKDARQRLLKPGARLVPNKIKVFGLPVMIPDSLLENKIVTKEKIKLWKELYDVDFSALSQNDRCQLQVLELSTQETANFEISGEAALLAEVDFYTFQDLKIQKVVKLIREKKFNGVLLYFELELGSQVITTHPKLADKNNHWLNQIWHLPKAVALSEGDSYTIEYSYNLNGDNSEIKLVI